MKRNTEEFVMPEYQAVVGNIHILDSYKVSKHDFKEVIEKIAEDNPLCLVQKNRSMFSLKMEWATHNFLYKIGFEPDRTRDVDLNWPMKWWIQLAYEICGVLTWLFIA